MEINDLKVGEAYRAKNPRASGNIFNPVYNDRQILWLSEDKSLVQYDAPAVKFGAGYKKESTAKFLKWAGSIVTDRLPPDDWEPWNK